MKRLRRLDRLLTAAEQAHLNENDDAALILLYAFLDVLGTATKVAADGQGNGPAFRRWVGAYVLPDADLPVTAEDRWGARCGMLHSLSHESAWSRRGDSRLVIYVRGEETADSGISWAAALQQAIESVPGLSRVPPGQFVIVHLSTLLRAVRVGFNRFGYEVLANDDLDKRITNQMDAALSIFSVIYN